MTRERAARDWQDISSAPRSTFVDLPAGGTVVTAVYLLGFVPELAGEGEHRQCGVIVVWWEPHRDGRDLGGWASDGGDCDPSHWMTLARAPEAA